MAFLALAAGADGLVWYWGPNGTYHMQKDAPTVWAGLRETVQELRGLMPFLTAPRGLGDTVEVADPFRAWSRSAEGKRVLAVVNSADAAATLDLDLGALGAREVSLRKTGETVPLAGGRLTGDFGPYEVRVYEWATAP